MSVGKKIGLRVFLEGVEIPCYRAMVQSSIGGPAMATMDVPPVEEFFDRYVESPAGSGNFTQLLGVQPRSLIHIFYEDSEDPDGVPRLLFEGEFVRFDYSKRSDGNGERRLTIVARDVSNILSSVYVRYYSDMLTPYNSLMSIFTGQATADKPNTETINLQILSAGIVNGEILGALQNDPDGFGIAAAFKTIATNALNTNTFLSGFDARTKISKKIVAMPDITSNKLLNATALAGMIQQNMGNLRESATVWDLYAMLMSMVFYFPTPIAAAPFLTDKVTGFGSADKGSKEFVVSKGKALMSLLLKPYTWWTAPPTFNVIFPDQYKSFSSRRDFLSEPTRLITSAFGVIDSISKEEFRTFLPSQFMFVSPRALLDRFDREAYDTQAQAILGSPTIKSIETEISTLLEQEKVAELKSVSSGLTSAEKVTEKSKVAALKLAISDAARRLKEAVADVKSKTNIGLASGKPTKAANVSAQLWNRNVLTDLDGVSLASREDIKGIVFSFDQMTQSQVEYSRAKGISPLALKDYMANIADYKLTLQQSKGRTSEMTLSFSPNLVPGFPALVIDPIRNHFGELDVVTHIIDAQGVADTQVQLSFVRNDEVEFAQYSRNTPGSVQFPAWINPLYLPNNIGTEVYAKLFPQNKPDKRKPGIPAAGSILSFSPSKAKNQISAAARIRSLYYSANNKGRFSQGFTRRNIASMDQVFVQVLGAAKSGGNYILNSFSDLRYKAVLAYASAANKVKSMSPSDGQKSTGT